MAVERRARALWRKLDAHPMKKVFEISKVQRFHSGSKPLKPPKAKCLLCVENKEISLYIIVTLVALHILKQ
jgi:hypothetical protein